MRRPLHAACVVTPVPLVYRLYRSCTASFAPSGTALTLVYQAKLYVVPLVPLLFYKLRIENYIYPVFFYIYIFSILSGTSGTRVRFR